MTVNELEPRGSCSGAPGAPSTFLGSHELQARVSLPPRRVRRDGLSVSRVKPLPAFMSSLDYRAARDHGFPEMYELMTMAR